MSFFFFFFLLLEDDSNQSIKSNKSKISFSSLLSGTRAFFKSATSSSYGGLVLSLRRKTFRSTLLVSRCSHQNVALQRQEGSYFFVLFFLDFAYCIYSMQLLFCDPSNSPPSPQKDEEDDLQVEKFTLSQRRDKPPRIARSTCASC